MSKDKKIKILLTFVCLLIVLGVVGFFANKRKNNFTSQVGQRPPPPEVKVHQPIVEVLPNKTVPLDFPSNLPLEKDATVTQNYTAIIDGGKSQSTREYVSKKTLAENYDIYKKYFEANGWKVVNSLDQSDLKFLAATSGQKEIDVNLNKNSISGLVKVSISLLTNR